MYNAQFALAHINKLARVGLASNLRTADENEINKAALRVAVSDIRQKFRHVRFGPRSDTLRSISVNEYRQKRQTNPNALWICLGDVVYDVGEWAASHPGGKNIIIQQVCGRQ